jgi:hypothetical protein
MKLDANPAVPRPATTRDGWAERFTRRAYELWRDFAATLNDEFDYRWDDLRMPAQAINPVGGASDPAVDNTESTGVPGTLLFSGTADNMVGIVFQMPHAWVANVPLADGSTSGVVRPHIHWAKTTATTGAVSWEMYYRVLGNPGDTMTAWSSAIAGTEAVTSTGDGVHGLTSFGDVTLDGYKSSCLVAVRLYRRGSADAYPSQARLFEFDVHYRVARLGTKTEIPTD